ncbi:MAG TPA: hypothetical protein VL098_06335 [Flavipsychrobacter sp.]|nr:hypothetical protein [Flavipsychrobacter sp.]
MKTIPESLLQSLETINGFDKTAFIEAHQQLPPTSVRLHPKKSTGSQLEVLSKIPWCDYGLYLPNRPVFTLDPSYHAGGYYVQEASSMFLHQVIKQLVYSDQPLRALDLCAAPGGKSTLLASLLDEKDLLVSNEVIRTRAGILEENVIRWGYSNNWVTSNDPKDFGRLEGYFDLVVVDAPCSGSGLFRKDGRALTSWTEANVALCASRQKRIIADVWGSLRENGILVYATCSYSPEENEQLLDWIASELDSDSLSVTLPENSGITTTFSERHQYAGYRFFPDKVKGEGFFIAAIRKTAALTSSKLPKPKALKPEKHKHDIVNILREGNWQLLEQKDGFAAIDAAHLTDYHLLRQFVYLRKTGVLIGNFTPKEWIPHHEVAMSTDKAACLPKLEVTKEIALKFLKKEELNMTQTGKGWYLVHHEGLSLGWIKALGNRVNNYLPKNWRIRMELPAEDWA